MITWKSVLSTGQVDVVGSKIARFTQELQFYVLESYCFTIEI